MRIAIIEDEAVVARRLERMVREIVGPATVEVAASFDDALAATRRPLDLLFLDLNLNGRDGFRLLEEAAASRFQTVVVSAHHDQALRAFEYGVTDFVAKPWTEARLRQAIDRVARRSSQRAGTLVVRKGRELRPISVDDIVFVRGADDYSEVHLGDGSVHLHEKSLTALESLLPPSFVRVHRSYIANLERARGVRTAEGGKTVLVLAGEMIIPIGRAYRDNVRQRILGP